MKIAICGLVKSSNLGEQFISKSLAWIITDELRKAGYIGDLCFVEVDIQATNDEVKDHGNIIGNRVHNLYSYTYSGIPADVVHYELKRVAERCKSQDKKNSIYRIRHYMWLHSRNLGKRYYRYYDSKLRDVDLIAIDGAGLLEYSYNAYQESLALLTNYAEQRSIPVIFNAIGRAGEFDKEDYRCQVLMSAFQHECVKYVSARDSRESVQECVGDRINVKLLADAEFCVDEAFGLKKSSREGVIGIGLIRGDAALSYSEGFESDDWIELFVNIAKELQKRGYDYEFFTNGASEDYMIGERVIAKLGVDKCKLVNRPVDARVLLETIASYSGIITCRMHSSIAAFTLGIPSVILSWNNKVDKYMEIVGYPDRAIPQTKFNATTIVNQMESAIRDGVSIENRMRMKKLSRASVSGFIHLIKN